MRAFETLYSRHRGALYRYLTRQARDGEIANDLFQEVWSRVIVNRARYEPRAKFRTFLFTLAHNCFIDHCRRTKARPAGAARRRRRRCGPAAGRGRHAARCALIERDESVAPLSRGARDPAGRTARRLSTARGVGFVARGHRARHRGRRRDREEPAALRGRRNSRRRCPWRRPDMTGPDDEFDDFLNRRKPVFRRPTDEIVRAAGRARPRGAAPGARGHRSRPSRCACSARRAGPCPIALAATLVLRLHGHLPRGACRRRSQAPNVPQVDPVSRTSPRRVPQRWRRCVAAARSRGYGRAPAREVRARRHGESRTSRAAAAALPAAADGTRRAADRSAPRSGRPKRR